MSTKGNKNVKVARQMNALSTDRIVRDYASHNAQRRAYKNGNRSKKYYLSDEQINALLDKSVYLQNIVVTHDHNGVFKTVIDEEIAFVRRKLRGTGVRMPRVSVENAVIISPFKSQEAYEKAIAHMRGVVALWKIDVMVTNPMTIPKEGDWKA